MFNHLGFAKGVGLNVRTHVLVDNNYTVCTANTKDKKTMEPEKDLDWKDVDCKKCIRTAFYKEAIQNLDPPEPPKDKKATKKKETKKKVVKKIANKKPENQNTQEQEPLKTDTDIENEKVETQTDNKETVNVECELDHQETGKTKLEETIKHKVKELNTFISDIIYSVHGQFYCVERADLKYRIIHEPSGKAMFDRVGQDLIIQALVALNWIKTQWDGKHIMPRDFITEMRQAMKYAFLISGQNYPKCLDDKLKEHKHIPNRKQKVIIKRRSNPIKQIENKKPEQKVIIKRRSKNNLQIPHRTKGI